MHALKTLFPSPADDWIVIRKRHCVCALKELRNERFENGLDPLQWMQTVTVNVLKSGTSWATWVAIPGCKQAINLGILLCDFQKQRTTFLCICGIRRLGLTSPPGITFTEAFQRPRAEVHGSPQKFRMMNSKYVAVWNARPRNLQSGNVLSSSAVLCG